MTRPVANNDYAIYVLIYGASPGNKATVRPLAENRQVRVTAKGTGNPGDLLVLADGVTTAADKGQGALEGVADDGIGSLPAGRDCRGGVCGRAAGEDASDVRDDYGLRNVERRT